MTVIEYEGTDIADHVTVSRCVYEAQEFGRVPTLSLEFADDAGLWDRWGPVAGDRVRVRQAGAGDTGAMYVDRVVPQAGGYALHATALPVADVRAVREWGETTAFTALRQIAAVLGLAFQAHGCADMRVAYARQDDERALPFAARVAVLAGCVFDVYDGTLHLCGREWIESLPAVGTLELGDDSDHAYTRNRPYRSCMVTQAETENGRGCVEVAGDGEPRLAVVLKPGIVLPGSYEVGRAARGLLAYENANRSGGNVHGGALSPYSPGSVVNIECADLPSLSGRAIITRVRNDFATDESKIWWRAL